VPLGKRAIQADIAASGDVDSYLIEAHAGARLDVKLSVKRTSPLRVDAELIGPDGGSVDAPFESTGSKLRLRRFDVPESGRYELRVSGRDGTSGAYSVSAKVKGSASVGLKGLEIGARDERAFPFAAGGGARLGFTVRSKPAAATFARIESPSGEIVPVPAGSVRANAAGVLKGKKIELPASGAFGTWRLVVRADAGALDGVRVKIAATGGRLPAVRGRLPAIEPTIAAVAPREAGPGTEVRVSGLGFVEAKRRPVRVFFDGRESTDVVLESETAVRASLPDGLSGTVDVAILTGDGHAAVLHEGVLAVPPPRVTSFAPDSGPADGGTPVEIRGSGFRPETAVTVAGTAFSGNTEFVSESLIRFTTPAFAGGPQTLGVRDPTGQEALASTTFEFVPAPFVREVLPPLVPRLGGEELLLRGGAFTEQQSVTIGGSDPLPIGLEGTTGLRIDLPELDVGLYDIVIRDPLGQESRTVDGVGVFTFAAGPAHDGAGGPPPSDVALLDYDDDGDLDVFLVSSGDGSLAAESLLRVLRNDGDDGYTDVTGDVVPDVEDDDWRGETIAFGDVAADVGQTPPDGWPDLVIGSLDDAVLPATRSRVRVLANRRGRDGERVFVDRTDVVMAAPSQYDAWRAEDLWIGDLDGDGGVPDIVATHDETPEGISPLPPYYVYYLSGTRVFSFATPQGGGYGRFAWQSRRMPHVIGTQMPTPGFPLCVAGACRGTYAPLRGRSLAVADLNDDGRRDIVVASPGVVTVNGGTVTSTQVAENVNVQGLDLMVDRGTSLSHAIAPLRGDIVLTGDVIGDGREDLVVVRGPSTGTGLAVDIVENRGFAAVWPVRTRALLPDADDDERLQADAAELADVDGDGDLDLVLLVVSAPTGGATATGLGLRVLRNRGEDGFTRELEELIPGTVEEIWNGTVLATGALSPGVFGMVIGRPAAGGDDTVLRTLVRTTED
jgi:hypothetical protein